MPPAWSVARIVDGCTLLAPFSVWTPSRSLTTRSYCALVRRATCEVTATPRLSQNVTPGLPEPPVPVIVVVVVPAVPVVTVTPVPALPDETAEPALPDVGLPEPPAPDALSPTLPTQPAPSAAAAKKITLQLFLFMALTSTAGVRRPKAIRPKACATNGGCERRPAVSAVARRCDSGRLLSAIGKITKLTKFPRNSPNFI